MDEADSATDGFDHDLALVQLSAKQNALCEVDQALKRLVDGRYGICEASGEPISPARLRAIPWARFTQAVEAQLEERGQAASTRVNRPTTVRSRGRIWFRHQKAHEEAVDTPDSTVPANDESLSEVYSPPGQRLVRHPPHGRPTNRRTKRRR